MPFLINDYIFWCELIRLCAVDNSLVFFIKEKHGSAKQITLIDYWIAFIIENSTSFIYKSHQTLLGLSFLIKARRKLTSKTPYIMMIHGKNISLIFLRLSKHIDTPKNFTLVISFVWNVHISEFYIIHIFIGLISFKFLFRCSAIREDIFEYSIKIVHIFPVSFCCFIFVFSSNTCQSKNCIEHC